MHHNVKTVEAHVLEYQQIISDLQMQVASLKLELHGSSGAKRPIGQDALPDPAGDDDWQVRQCWGVPSLVTPLVTQAGVSSVE